MSFHVALTGHRPDKLAGYDLSHPFYEALRERLKVIVMQGIEQHGHLTLHSGMAQGADTVWSQAALHMRHLHPDAISFVAEVPVVSQASRWSELDQQRWQRHLDAADEKRVYSTIYTPQAMWTRNHGMVDACDLLLAVWDGRRGRGGTAGTVAYAETKGVRVFRIDPDQFRC